MRHLSPGSPYFFPLPEHDIQHIATALLDPLKHGMSSTFLVKAGFGGGRALSRFLINCYADIMRRVDVPDLSETHVFAVIDPDDLTMVTRRSYLALVLRRIGEVVSMRRRQKWQPDRLKRAVWNFVDKKELVIVLRGFNNIECADTYLWATVRSLQVHPERVHFLFVAYEGGAIALSDKRFSPLRRQLDQNVYRFGQLSRTSIDYMIDRWGWVLERTFSRRERRIIHSISEGAPARVKALCFASAHEEDMTAYRKKTGYNSDDIVGKLQHVLGPKEFSLFEILCRQRGTLVTKDEIADVLWPGDSGECYSEGAIAQMVSRIRKKLRQEGFPAGSLRSAYRQGYVLG